MGGLHRLAYLVIGGATIVITIVAPEVPRCAHWPRHRGADGTREQSFRILRHVSRARTHHQGQSGASYVLTGS